MELLDITIESRTGDATLEKGPSPGNRDLDLPARFPFHPCRFLLSATLAPFPPARTLPYP